MITALAPWFGSNRTLAENVGAAMKTRGWVGVPFAGGMSELLHLRARTLLVSDLHTHVLNLAAVVGSARLNEELRWRLVGLPFHEDILGPAQARCRERERLGDATWFGETLATAPDLDWATDYFVCAWMARNGDAGTAGEFGSSLSVRWDAGGGDSATRFRHATAALVDWLTVMQRCTFIRLDVFRFLGHVKDEKENGVYVDPPFPEVGDSYKFGFSEHEHALLAERLAAFQKCRVVCRFYDHPLVAKLYPLRLWDWHHFEGRRSTNANDAPEVLLTRKDG